MKSLVILFLVLSCAAAPLVGQGPTILNTTHLKYLPMTGSPVSELMGYVDASGDEYVIVCLGNMGIAIVDVTNPATANVVKTIGIAGTGLNDVQMYGNYAYAVQETSDLLIIDLSVPTSASVTGAVNSTGGSNVFIDKARGLLYYCRGGMGGAIQIYDLANPAAPFLLGTFAPIGHDSQDVWADGDRCYDFDRATGQTRVLDVSNPAMPMQIGALPTGDHSGFGYHAPGGNSTFLLTCDEQVGGSVNIYDVTNDRNELVSSYQTDPAVSVHNAYVRGRYAYLSYFVDGLRVLDLSNPSIPVEVGIYDIRAVNPTLVFQGTWGVYAFDGGKVVITEMYGPQGINIIDFSPPPAVSLDLATTGVGDFDLDIGDMDPLTQYFLLVSSQTALPLGEEVFLGLGFDAIFNAQTLLGPPFRALSDSNGEYSLSVGPGILPAGVTVDFRAASIKQVVGTYVLSQLGRITF